MSAPAYHPKSGFGRALAVFVVAAFLLGSLPSPLLSDDAQAHPAETDTDIALTSPSMGSAFGFPVIYGQDALLRVRIEHQTSDVTLQRDILKDVSVVSKAAGSTAQETRTIHLVETGSTTGFFEAWLGFSKAAGANGTLVGDARIGSVPMIKVYSDNTTITVSKTGAGQAHVHWFESEIGTLDTDLGAADVVPGKQINITIDDEPPFGSTSPGTLRAYSHTSRDGVPLTLTTTSTGYKASLTVGDDIAAIPGDEVWVVYEDARNESGVVQPVQVGPWPVQTPPGTVALALDRAIYYGNYTSDPVRGRMVIYVHDPAENTDGGAQTVEAQITVGAKTIPLTLREWGTPANYFVGEYRIDNNTGHLPLDGDSQIQVTYKTKAKTVDWFPSAPDSGDTALTIVGQNGLLVGRSGDDYRVSLTLPDANLRPSTPDEVVVVLKSSTQSSNGLTVTLTETANNIGVFNGTFRVSTTAGQTGRLHVADGDVVIAEHWDTTETTGSLIRSAPMIWRALTTASLTAESTDYWHLYDDDGKVDTDVNITVIDRDQNHPHKNDTVLVDIGGKALRLRELGTDTGIFMGTATIAPSGGHIPSNAGAFSVTYEDILSDGTPRTHLLEATVGASEIAFVATQSTSEPLPADFAYLEWDNETIVRIGAYLQGAPSSSAVTVQSSSCPAKSIILEATSVSGGKGYYSAPLALKKSEGCPTKAGQLGVEPGDFLNVTLVTQDLLHSTRLRAHVNETLTLVEDDLATAVSKASGLNRIVHVRYVASYENELADLREDLFVQLAGQTAGDEPQRLRLMETGVDTGVFAGNFRFTTDGKPGSVKVRAVNDPFVVSGPLADGRGIMDVVNVTSGAAWGALEWYPNANAAFDVSGGTGTQPLTVELTDDDGLSHRVFQTTQTQTIKDINFTATPYIFGSESVVIRETKMFQTEAAAVDTSIAASSNAAENFTDWNGDGTLSCADIRIVKGERVQSSATGGESRSDITPTCEAVPDDSTIELQATGCTPPALGATARCEITIEYAYRAKPVESCGSTVYEYQRKTDGVLLCRAPTEGGQDVQLSYTRSQRNVILRSGAGETETVALTWSTTDKRFARTVPIELTQTSANGRIFVASPSTAINITYADPSLAFDSSAGSSAAEHLRRTVEPFRWTDVATASFTQPTGSHAAGPALFVQVFDPDGDTTASFDRIPIVLKQGTTTLETNLTEWEPGRFRGLVDTSGFNKGTMTLEYQDPKASDGQSRLIRKTMTFAPSEDGQLEVRNLTGGTIGSIPASGSFQVFLADDDRNQKAGDVETVQVLLRTAPGVHKAVTLTETGANTGKFLSAILKASRTSNDDTNVLFASTQVVIEYLDVLDVSGSVQTIKSGAIGWTWKTTASVAFGQNGYVGTGTAGNADEFGNISKVQVRLVDLDRNGDMRKIDRFTLPATDVALGLVDDDDDIAADAATTSVDFVETGPDTGTFLGTVALTSTVDSDSAEFLRLVVTDDGAATSDGTWDAEAETLWVPHGHGMVFFNKALYVKGQAAKLYVYDGSVVSNRGTPTVKFGDTTVNMGNPIPNTDQDRWEWSFTPRFDTAGTLQVTYKDKVPSTWTSSASAAYQPVITEAPTVTIDVASDDPGDDDWHRDTATATIESSIPGAQIFYAVDSGQPTPYLAPIVFDDEGVSTLRAWAEVGDLVGAQTAVDVKVDLNRPTATVTSLNATSGPGGRIDLAWQGCQSSPLDCAKYNVFRGTASTYVGTATTASFSDTPATEGTHVYWVKVADAANWTATASINVTGISDATAPRLKNATLDRLELFEEEGHDTILITALVEEADLSDVANVTAKVSDPFGTQSDVTLTRQGTSNRWTGSFSGFNVSGTYAVQVNALDEAGNADSETFSVVYHAVDRDPPRVEVESQIRLGSPLTVVVRENDAGLARVAYRLDDGAEVTVPLPSGRILTHTFTIPTTNLALGTHTLTFSLSDAYDPPNEATESVTFEVFESDPDDPDPPAIAKPTITGGGGLVPSGGSLSVTIGASALTALTVAFDGGAAQPFLDSWAAGTPLTVPVSSLDAGEHTATVTATNAGGTTTEDISFYVLDSGVPLPPDTVVVTKQQDGKPRIQWTASSGNVGGYLVHRAASESKVIAVLGADVLEFVDKSAVGGKQYTYAVTAYGTNGEGKLAAGAPSEDLPWFGHVTASSFSVDAGEPGLSNLWWVVLILAVVIGAAAVVYANRERLFARRGEEDGAFDDEYPDESGSLFVADQHDLRCPNCTHEFSVTGQKPIVTTCPNCGKKGILR